MGSGEPGRAAFLADFRGRLTAHIGGTKSSGFPEIFVVVIAEV